MNVTLADAAMALGVAVPVLNPTISSWSIDSRTIDAGAMYFALQGEIHDGHAFLDAVAAKGGVAAVVRQRTPDLAIGINSGLTFLRVADTLKALTDLAKLVRSRFQGTVIAVTGSAGKTTTKDIIWSLLSVSGLTGRTDGNFNNHIGVPLTLLRQPEGAKAHVIELAMNHAGEIRELCSIAKPEIGVVTNVGFAHVENFVDIEGIAAAKRELIESLPVSGVAVLNADDPRVTAFGDNYPGRTITYGMTHSADIRAEDVKLAEDGVRFRVGAVNFQSKVTGRHAVLNILAGVAVAGVLGVAPEKLKDAIAGLKPGKMRGERISHHGIQIINDSYNSNPEAVCAMLDVLASRPEQRKIAVLGEMRELGQWAGDLHRKAGAYAANLGIDVVIGIHGHGRSLVEEARKKGMPPESAIFFETPEQAGDKLKELARTGDVILFKGSRGTRVELALERF